jgi:hypothetical protein
MTQLARDVAARGFAGWLPYLDRSGDFIWTSDGAIAFPSADSLDGFIRGFAATLAHTELAFTEMHIAAPGPDVAQAAATYRELYVSRAGDTTRVQGVFVGVWIRSPFGWRLAAGHTSHAPARRTALPCTRAYLPARRRGDSCRYMVQAPAPGLQRWFAPNR